MKKEIPLLETPKYQAPHSWGFLFVGLWLGLGRIDGGIMTLKYNGIYQSEKKDGDSWSYYRFYEDGTVLSALSEGNLTQVSRWLTKEKYTNPWDYVGTYNLVENKINITLSAVDYGQIARAGVLLENDKIEFKATSEGSSWHDNCIFRKL